MCQCMSVEALRNRQIGAWPPTPKSINQKFSFTHFVYPRTFKLQPCPYFSNFLASFKITLILDHPSRQMIIFKYFWNYCKSQSTSHKNKNFHRFSSFFFFFLNKNKDKLKSTIILRIILRYNCETVS